MTSTQGWTESQLESTSAGLSNLGEGLPLLLCFQLVCWLNYLSIIGFTPLLPTAQLYELVIGRWMKANRVFSPLGVALPARPANQLWLAQQQSMYAYRINFFSQYTSLDASMAFYRQEGNSKLSQVTVSIRLPHPLSSHIPHVSTTVNTKYIHARKEHPPICATANDNRKPKREQANCIINLHNLVLFF